MITEFKNDSTTETSPATSADWHAVGPINNFPINPGIAVKIGDRQIAVYRFRPDESESPPSADAWYACDNTCPHKQDNVLARGITGDHDGERMVACPMHKKTFSLITGACLNDPDYKVRVYATRVVDDQIFIHVKRE